MKSLRAVVVAAFFLLITVAVQAQDVASFEKRTTVRKLSNGLTVILMQRAEAPVFSFYTLVDAGSAQDPKGGSGLAHMFEHMAFKGTPNIGTMDWVKEKALLDKVEKAYLAYDYEKRKILGRDEKKIADLDAAWRKVAAEADKLVKLNEFGQLVEEHGGVGLNATTFNDSTVYYYSMPANELEMWAYLESERMLHPVYREFYKERDVVLEERRLRVDSSPIGRLVEQSLAAAFVAHPYHVSGVGWHSEISSVTATDAHEFFKTYYTPSNITLAVVGDLQVEPTMRTIQQYFGKLPAGSKAAELRTVEPAQNAERKATLREPGGQPWYLEMYHRPGYTDPDDAVYDVIGDLMSNGRTSRLYRTLVRDKKSALFAGGFSGFPGSKYPNLFVFYAVPNRNKTLDDLAGDFKGEIERLKSQDISDDELKMIKTRIRADLLRGLADNEGLATQLATAQARYGDWRELFRQVERVDKVTKEDIRRVANKTFVANNRTVGVIDNTKVEEKKAEAGKEGN
ncbi:MAG: insulinase family protein [Acidobacteriales bacterium]|nr:insulinase family protein [Terriglobales bacterium]